MGISKKPVYVLGTGLSHDGSACLLKDGILRVAIEKERITRYKHDGFNDTAAIRYCLDTEGIKLSDLTLIVQNANFGMFERGNNWFRGKRLIEDGMPIVTISHHLAHAYSAFGPSPFDEAAVLVIDGCGNGFDECIDLDGTSIPERPEGDIATLWFEKDSYYKAVDGRVSPVFKDFSPLGIAFKRYPLCPGTTRHSIGGLYAAVSVYIFGGIDDSGKLMGLAPYGRAGRYDFEMFELREGRVFVRYDWMSAFRKPFRSQDDFKTNFQEYADLAYWTQKQVEEALLYVVRSRYELYPSRNLCYAGGVALNAVANSRILMDNRFEHIYIQPAAGDNGLAIGCAYYGWMEVLRREKIPHNGSPSLGRRYNRSEIEVALEKYKDSLSFSHVTNHISETAAHLSEGKVVAWFQDGAEFGPRALGNRSILADPRVPEVRDYINAKVKFREEFRPFAPSVMSEDVKTYFECDYNSPYMLLVAPVRQQWRDAIASVVHKDGSARIQTVTKELNPKYYSLLSHFKSCTGLGVLLNTSFNKRRMPIVETPEDAINFFLCSGLHVLVINDFVVRKTPVKKANQANLSIVFNSQIGPSLERNRAEAARLGGVYQLQIRELQIWTIDLSLGYPQVREGGSERQPDVIIEATDADFRTMLEFPGQARRLFQEGHLKIIGDLTLAFGLSELMAKQQT